MSALDLRVGDLIQFGGVSPQTVPCAGTNGNTRSQKVGTASVLGLVDLAGVKYSWSGEQLAKGKAKGFMQSEIGTVEIPAANLVIKALTSRVDLRSTGLNQQVRDKVTTSVGSITLGGRPDLVEPGQSHSFDGGVIQNQVVQNDDFYGTEYARSRSHSSRRTWS